MTVAKDVETPAIRRVRRPAGRSAGWAAALLLAILCAVWLFRVPIARDAVDRTLAAKRVPARYAIADLGLGRQRLTNVVLGDPAAPDLVADWIETQTDIGLSGPTVIGVRAGHVRLRGRLVDGRVSLGALDRLLPAPSGKPFALPALFVDVVDVRMRLETPAGPVGLKLSGRGRLNDGFRGQIAVVARRTEAAGCVVVAPRAALRIAIDRGAPSVSGPFEVDRLRCAGGEAAQLRADVRATFSDALDRWNGRARLAVAAAQGAGATTRQIAGAVSFVGSAAGTRGDVGIASGATVFGGAAARRITLAGRYVVGDAPSFAGRVAASGARVPERWLAALRAQAAVADGTPVGPLARKVIAAGIAAGRDFAIDGDVSLARAAAHASRLVLTAASGARVVLGGGDGVSLRGDGVRVDGRLLLSGGRLPEARVDVHQARPGAPVTGIAVVTPYTAGGAQLALTPVRFAATLTGVTAIETVATISGPIADGHVEALSLPVAARWNGAGVLVVNPGCAPLTVNAIAISGLRLAAGGMALCPVDGALLRVANGRIGGGARIAAVDLHGTLGSSPLRLATADAEIDLARGGLAVRGIAARLGSPERVTRLDVGDLRGRFGRGGLNGIFSGAAGQIGNVPLLLSEATGDWRFTNGALTLNSALEVTDEAAEPRFAPLDARGVTLSLVDGRVAASGTLLEPTKGVKVADVRLDHRLSDGTGSADLTVPRISFDKNFQPELLTRLTFGVIADVAGDIAGSGHIAWSPAGVTSSGDFRTDGTDLAAAFGPVTGISGAIHFTDLLALESAPAQVATIKSVNPGIAVEDGRIVYQTYAGSRVLVSSGRWPFAGGTLTLDPTLLDFSSPQSRRMTFRVEGMEAAQFLQQFDFKNLDATGVFDGALPMLFDASGGRIENGTLTVRPGGGTIAYVGDLSEKDLGTWGNLAFQALKSLRYRSLGITMNGPLAGEVITQVRFAGISQGQGAKSNFLVRRLQRLPFIFNVRIEAPFRGLLDTAQSFYDPKRLIERNLKPLLDAQNRGAAVPPPIQPPASETVP